MTDEPIGNADASRLVGKRIVVGLNRARADGTLIEKVQFHGVIIEADNDGVVVQLPSGERRILPPAWHAYVSARPGTYRLRSTGEEVVDPDLESIWTAWAAGTPDEWWSVVSDRNEQPTGTADET